MVVGQVQHGPRGQLSLKGAQRERGLEQGRGRGHCPRLSHNLLHGDLFQLHEREVESVLVQLVAQGRLGGHGERRRGRRRGWGLVGSRVVARQWSQRASEAGRRRSGRELSAQEGWFSWLASDGESQGSLGGREAKEAEAGKEDVEEEDEEDERPGQPDRGKPGKLK